MLKVAVVGLGIIGGSLAGALKKSGNYTVGGMNRSDYPIEYSLEHGFLDERAESLIGYDVVFIALPPEQTLRFLDVQTFQDGGIVADICGIKEPIEQLVYSKKRNYRYVGTHPMAGKEVSGIQNASPNLFSGANMVLTSCKDTDAEAYDCIKKMSVDMGFGRIVECSSSFHDKKIALTSQLAHILSNAYVKSDEIDSCFGFTGGSFQDMTRIAAVDENVWTDLYSFNSKNLLHQLNDLIFHLSQYGDALERGDKETLRNLLKEGRIIKETMKK